MSAEEDEDRRKVHLGGLSITLTESDLQEYFENYGKVDKIQIMPPASKRSTSTYGFVTFLDEEDTKRVLEDGQSGKVVLAGRRISVNPAKKRRRYQDGYEGDGDPGEGDDGYGSGNEDITKLFVGGIPETVNSAALKKHFEQFGEVPYVEMIIDQKTLKRRGYGFVVFADPKVAKDVLNMKTTQIAGSTVKKEKENIYFMTLIVTRLFFVFNLG